MDELAFKGDETIKQALVDKLQAFADADKFKQDDALGSVMFASIDGNKAADFEAQLGLPQWFILLKSQLFNNISFDDAKAFPVQVMKAIQPGQDLTKIRLPLIQLILANLAPIDDKAFPAHADIVSVISSEMQNTPPAVKILYDLNKKAQDVIESTHTQLSKNQDVIAALQNFNAKIDMSIYQNEVDAIGEVNRIVQCAAECAYAIITDAAEIPCDASYTSKEKYAVYASKLINIIGDNI